MSTTLSSREEPADETTQVLAALREFDAYAGFDDLELGPMDLADQVLGRLLGLHGVAEELQARFQVADLNRAILERQLELQTDKLDRALDELAFLRQRVAALSGPLDATGLSRAEATFLEQSQASMDIYITGKTSRRGKAEMDGERIAPALSQAVEAYLRTVL